MMRATGTRIANQRKHAAPFRIERMVLRVKR